MSYFPALPIFTWGNKPAASSVNPGTTIRISDVGLGGGIVVTSDGVNWTPAGAQMLARSAVAVSLTGTTSETTLATVTIPAGAMGLSGGIQINSTWTNTNSANNKFPRIRFDAQAALTPTITTTATFSDIRRIKNRASAGSQLVSTSNATPNSTGATAATSTAIAVDTTLAKDLTFTGQLALGSETIALEGYEVWLTP